MKYLISAVFALALSSLSVPAMASGCGGPEYNRQSTKVIHTALIKNTVENKEIYLTLTPKGPYGLKLTIYTKALSQPSSPYFFWHELNIEGTIPPSINIDKLNEAMNNEQATIELVEDTYWINCGIPDSGVEKNLRILLQYDSQVLEFRTGYVPLADPQ